MNNPLSSGTYFLIFLSCILFFLLFAASPMYIDNELKDTTKLVVDNKINELNNKAKEDDNKRFVDGLKIELEKVNKEIQARNDHEFDWLRLKYFVIGSLLLGFWYHAFLKNGEHADKRTKNNEVGGTLEKIHKHLTSPATSFILALTVIVGVTVDMQIRAGRMVIDQLGNWIYLYAEPILLGCVDDTKGHHICIGWEQFLRQPGAYHIDMAYNLSFWPNIYYLSIVIYAFYLFVSVQAAKVYVQDSSEARLLWLGFWLLHITLFFCALSNHIIPGMFRVTPFPIFTGWSESHQKIPSTQAIYIYMGVCVVLTLSSFSTILLNTKNKS